MVVWGNDSWGQVTRKPRAVRGYIGVAAGWKHTLGLLGPPSLEMVASGSFIDLSWPAVLLGRILQSTSRLEEPIGWNDFPEAPTKTGDWFRTRAQKSGGQEFYRLIQREVVEP